MNAVKDYATPFSILCLSGVLTFNHFVPSAVMPSVPEVDGQAMGKAYGAALLSSYGEAWISAAQTLETGKTVAEAQKALQDSWREGRTKAFKSMVEPEFSLVLPAGVEPADATKRVQVAKLWRAFAKGLTGAR